MVQLACMQGVRLSVTKQFNTAVMLCAAATGGQRVVSSSINLTRCQAGTSHEHDGICTAGIVKASTSSEEWHMSSC